MSIRVSVRDYRGVERCDIALDPLALLAGRNEAGKSSVAEATRAVLTGTAIPIPGVNKKDAKVLVRDGAEKGYVKIEGDETRIIEWPKASVTADSDGAPKASAFAVGLKHLFDLDERARAAALADYIDSEPSEVDLVAAMADIGYGDKAAQQTWSAIQQSGWDDTYKRAREYMTKLKGQWEGVTQEKYGAKKAPEWTPEAYPGADAERRHLADEVDYAQQRVKEAVGRAAVSAAEIERLQHTIQQAEIDERDPDAIEQQIADAKEELAALEAERIALPAEEAGDNVTAECPACGARLLVERVWRGPTVLKVDDDESRKQAQTKAVQKQRAKLDGKISNAKDQIMTLERQRGEVERLHAAAEKARAQLEKAGAPEDPDEATNPVAEAEAAEERARTALAAFDAKDQADRLHGQIEKNERLVGILAPDGLRRRKLAAGLEAFNARLADLCSAADWPPVRLDEDLRAHYGTRPLWAASGSGQWRARTCVQMAMALMDGSSAVVIDEADILDKGGRNGLFALLQASGMRALVCMTANKPDRIPDLEQVGLGQSYWIEAGKAQRIHGGEGEAKGAAA